MFTNGNQHFPSHMSTFLGSRSLILNVYTSRTLLDKQLGQLHNGSQTSMSGISICNDGTEIIDVGELGPVGFGLGGDSFFALLAVVEELGHEEVGDLVGDGGLSVVSLWH